MRSPTAHESGLYLCFLVKTRETTLPRQTIVCQLISYETALPNQPSTVLKNEPSNFADANLSVGACLGRQQCLLIWKKHLIDIEMEPRLYLRSTLLLSSLELG